MKEKDLQDGMKSMLGCETIIRRKNRTEKNIKKTQFLSIINQYEDALTRSMMVQGQFSLDLSSYEELFFQMLDNMMLLSWGENAFQLISFYLFERINPDNLQEQFIVGENGEEIFIKTPTDLYNTIIKLYPNTFS